MRAVPRIELPAGQPVKLAPGGLHIMMFDLKQTLKAGERVPLTLSVQPTGAASGAATTVTIEAEVRPTAPSAAHHHH